MGPRLDAIEEALQTLLRGQADLTVAFGKIYRRVQELEADAKWKRCLLTIGKASLPFVGGMVIAKWPALAALVGEILKAAAATPVGPIGPLP